MEVFLPMDFNVSSSAYPTSPFIPKVKTDYYFSPTRFLISVDHQLPNTPPATVPFVWEEKPGVPKSCYSFHDQHDFTFDVSRDLARKSVPADDLFDGGVIKILEKKRASSFSSSGLPSSRSRRTKSFSPNGGWEYPWEDHEQEEEEEDKVTQQSQTAMNTKPQRVSSCSSTLSASSSAKRSRKWSFMDLFLFRSASDGRAMERDPLKKYSANFRKHNEDFRNSNLRNMENHDLRSGSRSNKKGLVSAHELHYKVNGAIANDMKKKTFLPYKQGILGRLAINPTVHAISNGFGFSHQN